MKINNLEIKSYCRITNEKVILNNEEISVKRSEADEGSWLNDIYRSVGFQYLKFFKMDNLSKAGFIASELICNDIKLNREIPKKDIAIICFNSSSSLDDDTTFQNTIKDNNNYYPSPSVFVYTLANIVTGEIAIRNKILGESSFYITEKFSPKLILDSISFIFKDKNINGLLFGWTEYYNNNCDILMMYISRTTKDNTELTETSLSDLYI